MLLGTEATTIRGFVYKLKVKKDFAILVPSVLKIYIELV